MTADPIPLPTLDTLAADRRAEARARLRHGLARALIYGSLSLFAAIYLLPAFVLVTNAFRDSAEVARHGLIAWPEGFSWVNFTQSWSKACVSGTCSGIAPNFLNSLMITIPAVIIATGFGALNGYVLSQWRFRGADLLFGVILFGVFLPGQITLLPWAFILGKLNLANSVQGLVLVHAVQGLSFATLFCRNFYTQIPTDLVKAARIDGAGFWRIFGRIILPLSPPILIVTVIWQFTSVWNDYLFGLVFSTGTGQPVTAALMSARAGGQSAAVLIAALPPLLVYLFGGRFFVRGLTMGALR